MSSSPNLQELEIKEATPSIAPSIYESLQYTKKWRILLALAIGASLLGVCALGLYLGAEARSSESKGPPLKDVSSTPTLPHHEEASWLWRSLKGGGCLTKRSQNCSKEFGDRVLLVVAFGGFRPDQIDKIPAFKEFQRCGVSSPHLVPSYPTFNYPNLYTIATGFYTEAHGIVSYKMYDKDLNLNFTIGSPSSYNDAWWGGEPIWNSVNKQGKRSAAYLWPGSDVRIQDRYPSYWQKEALPFKQRIAKILNWVRLPKAERPHLIMMYFDEPSMTSQKHGIFSDQTTRTLNDISLGVDELMSSLDRMKMFNCVDLIVVSDHGIAPFRCEDSIYVDDILENPVVERVYTGPVGRLRFTEDSNDADRSRFLETFQCKKDGLRVLKKSQVPKRYHYANNARIGNVILDTKVGSHVSVASERECLGGEFGYDNLSPAMQGVFMAHGTSFKEGYKTHGFRNVEVYNLMCLVLGIKPSANNGTTGSLVHLLNDELQKSLRPMKDDTIFLREMLRPRPQRMDDAIIGLHGQVKDSDRDKCRCDISYEEETSTTPPSTSTKTTTTTSQITISSKTNDINGSTTESLSSTVTSSTSSTTDSSSSISSTSSTPSASTPATSDVSTSSSTPAETSDITSTSTQNVEKAVDSITEFNETDTSVTENLEPEEPLPLSTSTAQPLQEQSQESLSRLVRAAGAAASPRAKYVKEDDSQIIETLKGLHSPWGLPQYSAPEVASDVVNILLQTSHILGFPESLNLGIWSSFTLTKDKMEEVWKSRPAIPEGINLSPEELKRKLPVGCWIADPRLNRSNSDQCHRSLRTGLYESTGVTLRQLFPEEFESNEDLSTEGFLLSNLAPIRSGYETTGRIYIIQAITKWLKSKSKLNVITGPIFDYDHDGRRDDVTVVRDSIKPLIPSDYFYIITNCNSTSAILESCPSSQLHVQSFVFPNTGGEEGCQMTQEEYLLFHMASVADIETLSGLRFFRDISSDEYVMLRSRQILRILPQ